MASSAAAPAFRAPWTLGIIGWTATQTGAAIGSVSDSRDNSDTSAPVSFDTGLGSISSYGVFLQDFFGQLDIAEVSNPDDMFNTMTWGASSASANGSSPSVTSNTELYAQFANMSG